MKLVGSDGERRRRFDHMQRLGSEKSIPMHRQLSPVMEDTSLFFGRLQELQVEPYGDAVTGEAKVAKSLPK